MIMVQMSGDQVIRMVAVRDALVAASRAVDVRSVVAAALVIWCTRGRIGPVDRDRMLIDVAGMQMMQMAIVKVVGMIFMNHCHMAAM